MPRSTPRAVALTAAALALAASALTATAVTNPAGAATSGVPFGHLDSVTSSRIGVRVTGWAIDPDTYSPIAVTIIVDGRTLATQTATKSRPDVAAAYGAFGADHGFAPAYVLAAGSHSVCVTARNVGAAGTDKALGCRSVAVVTNPAATTSSAPLSVSAHTTSTAATVAWRPPLSYGGAPITQYVITTSPPTVTTTVGAIATRATVTGLSYAKSYRFTVRAVNPVGTSPASSPSAAVMLKAPVIGAVTAPALISTSRYIRNISGASSDTTKARAMGVADGAANPSNHRYLALLQIGGQTTSGVVLTATSTYVSYGATVTAMRAYLDGYASTQHANAPATIAFGTNNDMDVRRTTGAIWADQVVDPLVAYAKRYPNITVAGANDIEPGFRGSAAGSMDWIRGYLAATSAKFVFNGSADGCSPTSAHSACNNGWRADYISWMAGGLAPTRILAPAPDLQPHDAQAVAQHLGHRYRERPRPHQLRRAADRVRRVRPSARRLRQPDQQHGLDGAVGRDPVRPARAPVVAALRHRPAHQLMPATGRGRRGWWRAGPRSPC